MKSNFNKSKRYAPKTSKKRHLKSSPSKSSLEPVKTKPLNMEAIKKAQDKVKEEK